jgi:hypothetical protein
MSCTTNYIGWLGIYSLKAGDLSVYKMKKCQLIFYYLYLLLESLRNAGL